jgi:hypothetical protein
MREVLLAIDGGAATVSEITEAVSVIARDRRQRGCHGSARTG